MPAAEAVDLSRHGCLIAFAEPIGLVVGRRLLISTDGQTGRVHAMGAVVRCERGSDFRTYVAIQFTDLSDDEYDEYDEFSTLVEAHQLAG